MRRARKDKGKNLLLMAAESDTVVPLSTVRELAKLYGGAKIEILAGQPHITPNEVQKRFPKVIEHFKAILLPEEKPKTKE